jgi:LysM repeat protein
VNTLKTLVVLAVLAIVGYGLYVGLNNGFQFQNTPAETPAWLTSEMGTSPGMPQVGMPQVGLGSQTTSPAPGLSQGIPSVAPGSGQIPQASYPSAGPPTSSPTNNPAGAKPLQTNPAPANYANLPSGGPTGPVLPSGGPTGPVAISPAGQTTSVATTKGTGIAAPPPSAPIANYDPTGGPGPNRRVGSNPNGTPPIQPTAPPVAFVPGGTPPPATATGGGPPNANFKSRPQTTLATAPSPQGAKDADHSNSAFEAALQSARSQLQQGQMATALLTLSIWYEDPRIQAKQHEQLTNLLDRIAGSVIYSRKHLIEPAYRVRQGESLQQIALVHKIPEGLLRKINQIENRAVISPGQELKVVRGPFNATINSKKQQLTLWLGGRYAGRFALILGPEFEQIVGPFVVQDKTRMHRNHDNQPWIQLGPGYGLGAAPVSSGPQLGIAGMVNTARAIPGDRPGRIGVSSRDADDLFDILSQGSKVTIRR